MCSHCTRDLVLFKPLALRLQALSHEVDQLKVLITQQTQTISQLQAHNVPAAALTYAAAIETQAEAENALSAPSAMRAVWRWASMVCLTIATIGLCHWVLLFVYDAPPLFLRLLTITWPALTGYVCARRSKLGGLAHFFSALLVAVLSVGLMLAITAHIDGVPLWPDNVRDWRETLEYTLAIGLGFFTGYLMHLLVARWAKQRSNKVSLRVLLARDANGQFKITEISNQVQGLITATAPLVSAGAALYSGLKAFTGS